MSIDGDSVDIPCFLMDLIIRNFVHDINENEYTTNHTHRKAGHIDKGIHLVSLHISPCDFQIVVKHDDPPIDKVLHTMRKCE